MGDIRYLLSTKVRVEGPAVDSELVESIKKIERPVILDVSRELCVEGRHRLTAALKKGLPVPVLVLE